MSCRVVVIFIFFSVLSCTEKKDFKHELAEGRKPWLHENFDGEDKFTFGIITDLNGGEREGIFEVAIEQLNLLRPEFILTVGDLIDGVSEDTDALNKEWDYFDARASKAKAPLFHVGGNHDLTNPGMREVWASRYGAYYYHFVYKDMLFLILDTEDYSDARRQEIFKARDAAIKVMDGPNPEKANDMEYFKMQERITGEIGNEQSTYFKKVLEQNPTVKWTFLFMHKPVWQRTDEGGLTVIEQALGTRPYTVFNGHVHSYSHTKKSNQDYIILGTTGGSQNKMDSMSFDHITLVTVDKQGPSIANLRLDGILDRSGKIPLQGDTLCFQASACK
ncbi:MAG: metallophosphoesterase [Cyclobacteriaceae bacterium]|nr:metallophosphoesterase [Cyclobacteriaceae bacterium]